MVSSRFATTTEIADLRRLGDKSAVRLQQTTGDQFTFIFPPHPPIRQGLNNQTLKLYFNLQRGEERKTLGNDDSMFYR